MITKRNVVFIILFDNDKKILVQHRTANAPKEPNKWGFFGGGIKEDHTAEQLYVWSKWKISNSSRK